MYIYELCNCRAKFQGAGCSSLTYHWYVEYAGPDDVIDADVTENLQNVTDILNSVDDGVVELTGNEVIY